MVALQTDADTTITTGGGGGDAMGGWIRQPGWNYKCTCFLRRMYETRYATGFNIDVSIVSRINITLVELI